MQCYNLIRRYRSIISVYDYYSTALVLNKKYLVTQVHQKGYVDDEPLELSLSKRIRQRTGRGAAHDELRVRYALCSCFSSAALQDVS